MIDIAKRFAAFAAACALLTACGGGTSGSPSVTPSSPKQHQSSTATFVVKIPATAKNPSAKRPAYITSNVQGIDFAVTNMANSALSGYVFYALTPQSTYCSSSSSGLTCSLDVNAPPGFDTFIVRLYDSAVSGDGYVVATGNVTATIAAQAANVVNITTDGVAVFASVGISNPYPASGSAQSIPLRIQATDADGNIIVGSFDQPILLVTNDTSGALTFSKSSFSQTSDLSGVTLNYNGAVMGSPAYIYIASTSPMLGPIGTPQTDPQISGQMPFQAGYAGPIASPSSLSFAHANSPAQTVTITAANGATAPFSVDENAPYGTCTGFVTISGSSPTFTVTPVASTFGMNPPLYNAGVCMLNVTSTNGGVLALPVIVWP